MGVRPQHTYTVERESDFDRLAAAKLIKAYAVLIPEKVWGERNR